MTRVVSFLKAARLARAPGVDATGMSQNKTISKVFALFAFLDDSGACLNPQETSHKAETWPGACGRRESLNLNCIDAGSGQFVKQSFMKLG